MELERIDKILAGTGCYTRSEAKSKITGGMVLVDGTVIRRPETKVPRSSTITVDGKTVNGAEYLYLMMDKPQGYITSTQDGDHPAVTGLLEAPLQKRGLVPVGRRDGDVSGLLLFTDDGNLAHKITSPRSGVE